MKVIMTSNVNPKSMGGVGIHTLNLATILSKEVDIEIISPGDKNIVMKKNNVKIKYKKLFIQKRFYLFQKDFIGISEVIHNKKVDILHIHDLFSPFNFMVKHIPIIVTVHGYSSLEAVITGRIKPNSIQFKFMRFIEKKTAHHASAIIAVGPSVKKWILKDLNVSKDKVFYIPNGINPHIFKPFFNNKLPFKVDQDDHPKILFTKHFTPQYGAKDLIDAFKLIANKYSSAKLIMVGEDECLNHIKKYSVKLRNKIIFPGKFENNLMPMFYNASDIFVNPSRINETFGITIIEAMACEKPVIATAVGGPKEIIEEGFRQMGKPVGILVPPKNPEALADAIEYLIEHPEEAREMGKRAREYVLKNYTWEIVAKKTLEVYKYVLQKT